MVRLKKAKKRHTTSQDFKKKTNKVGKSTRKENATNTTIVSKGLFIAQSFASSGRSRRTTNSHKRHYRERRYDAESLLDEDDELDEESERALQEGLRVAQDLLAKVSHHNASVRQDAIQGLVLAVESRLELLQNSSILLKIIDRVFPRIADAERGVRSAVRDLFEIIASAMDAHSLTPYHSLLLAHTVSAMTHIRSEVRTFSVDIIDIWLSHAPQVLLGAGAKVLEGFLQLISSNASLGSQSAATTTASSSSAVARGSSGPKLQLTSKKARLRVLRSLLAFLSALLRQGVRQARQSAHLPESKRSTVFDIEVDMEEASDEDDDDDDVDDGSDSSDEGDGDGSDGKRSAYGSALHRRSRHTQGREQQGMGTFSKGHTDLTGSSTLQQWQPVNFLLLTAPRAVETEFVATSHAHTGAHHSSKACAPSVLRSLSTAGTWDAVASEAFHSRGHADATRNSSHASHQVPSSSTSAASSGTTIALNTAAQIHSFATENMWPILRQVWLEVVSTRDEIMSVSMDSPAETIASASTLAELAQVCTLALYSHVGSSITTAALDSFLSPLQELFFEHFPFGGRAWPTDPRMVKLNTSVAWTAAVACTWTKDAALQDSLDAFITVFLQHCLAKQKKEKQAFAEEDMFSALQLIVHLSQHHQLSGNALTLITKLHTMAPLLSTEKQLTFSVLSDILLWLGSSSSSSSSHNGEPEATSHASSSYLEQCLKWFNTLPRLLWELGSASEDFTHQILSFIHTALSQKIFADEALQLFSKGFLRFLYTEAKGKVIAGPFNKLHEEVQVLFLDCLYFLPKTLSFLTLLYKYVQIENLNTRCVDRMLGLIGEFASKVCDGAEAKNALVLGIFFLEIASVPSFSGKQSAQNAFTKGHETLKGSVTPSVSAPAAVYLKGKQFKLSIFSKGDSACLHHIHKTLRTAQSLEAEYEGDFLAGVIGFLEAKQHASQPPALPLPSALSLLSFAIAPHYSRDLAPFQDMLSPIALRGLVMCIELEILGMDERLDSLFYAFLQVDAYLEAFVRFFVSCADGANVGGADLGASFLPVLRWLCQPRHVLLHTLVKEIIEQSSIVETRPASEHAEVRRLLAGLA